MTLWTASRSVSQTIEEDRNCSVKKERADSILKYFKWKVVEGTIEFGSHRGWLEARGLRERWAIGEVVLRAEECVAAFAVARRAS